MKHLGPISGIATFGESLVATAGYDNQILLWNAHDRTPLTRSLHDHLANQCSFSSCGRYLASASSDYSARIWEVPSLRLLAVCQGHGDDVEMAAWSPDNRQIATCSRDTLIRVFSAAGQPVSTLRGHEADVISVTWEPCGRRLISSSDDGTVRRWDIGSATPVESIDVGGIETDTIVITPDGSIFAGNDEGEILTLRGGTMERVTAHRAGIKRLAFDPQQRLLVSLSYDRTAMLWRVDEGLHLHRVHKAEMPSIVWPRSCAFLGGSKLVFGTFGSTYAVYNWHAGTWDLSGIEPDISLNAVLWKGGSTYTIGDAGRVARDGVVLQDLGSLCNFLTGAGDMILTGGQMGTLFDAVTGRVLYQHHSPLNCGDTFSRDGRLHAVIGAYTGEGIVLRLGKENVEHVETIRLHDNAIKGVACSEHHIFSVCATGAAAFHRVRDLQREHGVADAHDRIANGCVALPNGLFASISRDLKLRLWDGPRAVSFPSPHLNSIKCVAASKDGSWLATGSYGGTIAFFDVHARQWGRVVRPTSSGISNLARTDMPGRFLASSYDGNVREVSAR